MVCVVVSCVTVRHLHDIRHRQLTQRRGRSEDGSIESDTLIEVAMTDAEVHADLPQPVFM